ncbi:MAG: stage 0 sporulation family protein [Coriobacteriia bacterium]|nr:stage 0 sporulation family protein [Coriobacteriia bacterium]
MPTVTGVRLRFSKTLWFDPAGAELAEGDIVIVETERGTESGAVTQPPHEVSAGQLPASLKPVLRVAGDEDLARLAELKEQEAEALRVFRSLIVDSGLDMKPVDVEFLFDGDKIIFYFSAEERVDFRNLVRELAARYRARIDMRQVGVRDEARTVGGLGHCGQLLCCVRLGGEFQPVSIRMAKEQDLPLNPLKISGLCGRLMCCLRYEHEAYKDYKSRAPKRGAMVETPGGQAKVTELNTPKETVTVRLEDGSNVTVPLTGMCCAKDAECPCVVTAQAYEAATSPASSALLLPDAAFEEKYGQARLAADSASRTPDAQKPSEEIGRRRRRRGRRPAEGTAGKEQAADGSAGKRQQAPSKSQKAGKRAADGSTQGRASTRGGGARGGGSARGSGNAQGSDSAQGDGSGGDAKGRRGGRDGGSRKKAEGGKTPEATGGSGILRPRRRRRRRGSSEAGGSGGGKSDSRPPKTS